MPKFLEKYELGNDGKNPSDAAIRQRQKTDLARAYRMLKEDPSGTANEAPVQRDRFITDAMANSRTQANLDDKIKQIEAASQSRNKSQRSPSFADFKEKDRQEENARAAIAERDGVYIPPQSNSAAANAERDGGPSYLTPKSNSAAADAERDGKRIIPKAITDKVKGFGFTPGTPDFEEAERQFERAGASVTRQPIGSAGSGGSKYAKGGSVSASRRADGIAQRGKTKGRMC